MSDTTPKSPCISICVLDDDDICMGCYRSAQEITDWFMASDEQKNEVLRKARERLQGSFKVRLS
ncbi:MAG: DUF1289 domain-containing protein [Haliea sp.]|jgi:predicted Fe-S protein YdhL (DUF1289 family)|nr:DUF1289 domain-containing protein [Haliea sp.]MBK6737244.1 DUF1289 domain-containing protein [Haliea sp.]